MSSPPLDEPPEEPPHDENDRPGSRVGPLQPGERRPVTQLLARAFFDDPVAIYLFPTPERRRRGFERLTALEIDAFGEDGLVMTDQALQGAAIWRLPRPKGPGLVLGVRSMLRVVALMGFAIGRIKRLNETMAEHAPPQPYYYLATLGTDPAVQRRGVGSALLRPVLDRCDREAIPAYLESSKAANVPFYRRHGFEVEAEIEVPDGPTLWTMSRPPGGARR